MKKKEKDEIKQIEEMCRQAVTENLDLKAKLEHVTSDYEEQKRIYDEMLEVYQGTRRLKHDMRNHLMMIAACLQEGKTESALQYTSQILDKMNLDYSYVVSGNELLNYILNEKLSVAKRKGVYVKAEIENLKFGKLTGVDFSALIGNILDNALNGAENSIEKQMHITVKKKRGYETVKVSNSIDCSVLQGNPMLETTKEDRETHGFGIAQIRSIVEKYNGMLDIWEENEMFHIQIMFEEEKPAVD